jgi:tellurite resistance protein TehA-like permease
MVAIVMIATSGGFPFNMGWWGFIFPVGKLMVMVICVDRPIIVYLVNARLLGVFTLLTISLGEELESKFFKVLSCVSTI